MILNDDLLPVNMELLVTMKGMDDSLLVGVTKNNIHHTLTIILRSGDLSIGYFDLVLEYFDAVISPLDEWKLAYIAKTTIDDGHHVRDICKSNCFVRCALHPQVWITVFPQTRANPQPDLLE